jgi:hypothetical protein
MGGGGGGVGALGSVTAVGVGVSSDDPQAVRARPPREARRVSVRRRVVRML